MKKLVCLLFFATSFLFAGTLSDTQMKVIFENIKASKFDEAAAAVINHLGTEMVNKEALVQQYSSYFRNFTMQHGVPLDYMTLQTRKLSKNKFKIAYMLNCEKSAWVLQLTEYVNDKGESFFWECHLVTEDDVFKNYEK